MYTDAQLIKGFRKRKWKQIKRHFISVVNEQRYYKLTREGLTVYDGGCSWRLGGFTPWAREFYALLIAICKEKKHEQKR